MQPIAMPEMFLELSEEDAVRLVSSAFLFLYPLKPGHNRGPTFSRTTLQHSSKYTIATDACEGGGIDIVTIISHYHHPSLHSTPTKEGTYLTGT